MSSDTNIKDCRPWWHVSNKIKRNPFDPIYLIESLEWCHCCQMDVDVSVEAAHEDGIDVYRKRCKRCGFVMAHGIAKRHITHENERPLPMKAINFIKQRGQDRR